MHRKNILNDLFEQVAMKDAESSRNKNINKFIQCFNVPNNNRCKQIRILQIGTPNIATITKKPFLTTQPIKKHGLGLFNNQIIAPYNSVGTKDVLMQVEAIKAINYQSSPNPKGNSKTLSPQKTNFMAVTEYVALNSNPKKTKGWISRKKKIQQLPKQFYRRSSQNAPFRNSQQIKIDQEVSKSVNLLSKVKIVQQYPFITTQNKSSNINIVRQKPKTKGQSVRKTPQDIAEEQRRNKLELKKQISQDYAKPFNPPTNITAASYIIFQPKFSDNKGRKRKYFMPDIQQQQHAQKNKKKYPHSHKVIASHNSRNAVQIASLTKIMTCILALQICQRFKLDSKQQHIQVGKFQSNIGGTSAQISQGQTYTLQDLYYGLMLPSGNDASVALAVWGGRVLLTHEQPQQLSPHKKKQFYQRFITQMNVKSKSLGMHKTNYANSHGLVNSQNKSCAFDLAILCEYAMNNYKFRQIVSCKIYRNTIWCTQSGNTSPTVKKNSLKDLIKDGEKDDQIQQGQQKDLDSNQQQNLQQMLPQTIITQKTVEWYNTHRLVQQKSNQYIGIKTGITTAAGPCLASCVKAQNGRYFIIIVLNCDKLSMRFKDTQNLKKWIFQRQGMNSPRKKQQTHRQNNLYSPREECMSPTIIENQ